MNPPWIEVSDLHLSRGGRPVLMGITAALHGRAVGLVGANGAGKSTFIGALLGILAPDKGKVTVLGLEQPAAALEIRTRAGVMAEQAGIFPGGSGVDAVVFAGMLSGLIRKEALRRAHRALDALDVGEERYRPTSEYSTGMRQRCKMAMSLVHDPEVLILDEPTVGLDPPGRTQLLELIRGLRDEGRRILISTHILADAEFLCDEMLLLDAGTVAFSGPVAAMIKGREERFVASGDRLDATFVARLAQSGIPAMIDDAGRLVLSATDAESIRRFWSVASECGAAIRRLDREAPTLEEALLARLDLVRGNGGAR
ncbi:MAG TPA: ABC transporter ATP-binding protein [Candidatus Eisenbacteria bacterium]